MIKILIISQNQGQKLIESSSQLIKKIYYGTSTDKGTGLYRSSMKSVSMQACLISVRPKFISGFGTRRNDSKIVQSNKEE